MNSCYCDSQRLEVGGEEVMHERVSSGESGEGVDGEYVEKGRQFYEFAFFE
jgi:hypothetical protein